MPLFYSPGWFDKGTTVQIETATDTVTIGSVILSDAGSSFLQCNGGYIVNSAGLGYRTVGGEFQLLHSGGKTLLNTIVATTLSFQINSTEECQITAAGLVLPAGNSLSINGSLVAENTGFITVPGLIALTAANGIRITNFSAITGSGTKTFFAPDGAGVDLEFRCTDRRRINVASGTVQTGAGATATVCTSPTLDDNAVHTIYAWVTGGKSDETEGCGYMLAATYRRAGAGPVICGAVTAIYTGETDAGANATLVIVGNTITVDVTSPAGDTYDWFGSMDWIRRP